MKINCVKCGKRFNAEEHMYICPKCNHYHSQAGARSEITKEDAPVKKYRWETDPIELPDEENFFKRKRKTTEIASWDAPTIESESSEENKKENEYEDVTIGSSFLDLVDDIISPDDAPEQFMTLEGLKSNFRRSKQEEENEKKVQKIKWIGTIAIAVIVLISFGVNALNEVNFKSVGTSFDFEDDSFNGEEYYEVEYGKPMEFDTFTVNVGAVGEPDIDNLKCSKGYKLIQIDFKTEAAVEDDSIYTDVNLICDGEWYYALYEDELTNKSALQDELWEEGLIVEAQYEGDYFWIFEVPEDSEIAELEIISYISEDDSGWYSSMEQEQRYVMPIEL